jgi:glycerophosphoryl diester phosphodiesterase
MPLDRTAPTWLTARPIAHRGLHDKAAGVVENTRSAFAAAIAGQYAIECDLQLTKDGEAVVFHDERLDRLTDSSGWVKDITAARMQALTLRGSPDHVQTLAELVTQVAGQVPLVIEIKTHWDGDERLTLKALDILKTYDGPCCLMSFDPDVLATLRTTSPQTIRGFVADGGFDDYYNALPLPRRLELRNFSHMARTAPHFISYRYDALPYAPVTAFRAAGHPVITWTIRSPAQEAMARRYSDQITFERYRA